MASKKLRNPDRDDFGFCRGKFLRSDTRPDKADSFGESILLAQVLYTHYSQTCLGAIDYDGTGGL